MLVLMNVGDISIHYQHTVPDIHLASHGHNSTQWNLDLVHNVTIKSSSHLVPQAQCGNIVSYGKRKRRSLKGEGGLVTLGGELTLVGGEITLRDVEVLDDVEEEEEDHVYHEMPLQKEILVESSSVKPLKSGLLPEETGKGKGQDNRRGPVQ